MNTSGRGHHQYSSQPSTADAQHLHHQALRNQQQHRQRVDLPGIDELLPPSTHHSFAAPSQGTSAGTSRPGVSRGSSATATTTTKQQKKRNKRAKREESEGESTGSEHDPAELAELRAAMMGADALTQAHQKQHAAGQSQASTSAAAEATTSTTTAQDEPSTSAAPAKVKKRRITLACYRCRAKKARCDGNQPCAACATAGEPCEHPAKDSDGRKRKSARTGRSQSVAQGSSSAGGASVGAMTTGGDPSPAGDDHATSASSTAVQVGSTPSAGSTSLSPATAGVAAAMAAAAAANADARQHRSPSFGSSVTSDHHHHHQSRQNHYPHHPHYHSRNPEGMQHFPFGGGVGANVAANQPREGISPLGTSSNPAQPSPPAPFNMPQMPPRRSTDGGATAAAPTTSGISPGSQSATSLPSTSAPGTTEQQRAFAHHIMGAAAAAASWPLAGPNSGGSGAGAGVSPGSQASGASPNSAAAAAAAAAAVAATMAGPRDDGSIDALLAAASLPPDQVKHHYGSHQAPGSASTSYSALAAAPPPPVAQPAPPTPSVSFGGVDIISGRPVDGGVPSSSKRRRSDSPDSNERLRLGMDQSAVLLQYSRPFGPTAIQPGLEQISIAIRAPPSYSRAGSPSEESPATGTGSALGSSSAAGGGMSATVAPGLTNGTLDTTLPEANHHLSTFPFTPFSPFPGMFNSGDALGGAGSTPSFAHMAMGGAQSTQSLLFGETEDVPRQEILDELIPLFFKRLGAHFPFLTERQLREMDQQSTARKLVHPLLLNMVCAMAARFSESPLLTQQGLGRTPATYGIPFADKAKSMLTPLLSYPTHACVAAILLLAWHEFGINCESSLWMYTGMAVRMAMDLGLHQDLSKHRPDVSPKQVAQERLLWWSVFIMDRILLFGTGRTQTVKDDEITTLLPTDEDMTLVQGSGAENPSGASAPFAFPIYVRLMQLNGIMGEHVNKTGAPFSPQQSGASSRADPASNAGAVAEAGRHDFQRRLANMGAINSAALNESILCQVEDELTRLYNDLPESLQFAPANFRAQEACHMAPIFVQLHLWYNCLIILLYRPPLLHPKTNAANLSLQDRLAVVSNSCLAIGQIVEYADDIGLGSANAYVASPFVNQCLYVAATAWIQDYRIRTGRNVISADAGPARNSSTNILASVALRQFQLCKKALELQTEYFTGVSWISALAERYGHTSKKRVSIKKATEHLETFVSSQEMNVFRRLLHRTVGASPNANLNDDSLNALFAFLQQDNFSAPQSGLSQDDMALAYTFAGVY